MDDNLKQKETRCKKSVVALVSVMVLGVIVLLLGYKSEIFVRKTDTLNKKAVSTYAYSEYTVSSLLEEMSLRDKVYQMMFVTPESITGVGNVVSAGETTQKALEKYPVGGIVYFARNFETREQTIDMLSKTQSYSKIPLFMGVDEEGGPVARLSSNKAMGVTSHPPMLTIGETNDPSKAYEVGLTLGKELVEFGFNVDFAPVADVLVNSKNTEIGNRSFGSDPGVVSAMVSECVKGLEENGVSSVLKHFPGHASTVADSHKGTSVSLRTLDELRKCEFLPFKAGIEAGCNFVMISHMTLNEAISEKIPASLSKEVITGMLRGELGYNGIVITDSFSMGAICNNFAVDESALMAIYAGVDMILMPPDPEKTCEAIIKAVEDGRLAEDRIDESVEKILTLKKKMFAK